jgi:hypothetical protein
VWKHFTTPIPLVIATDNQITKLMRKLLPIAAQAIENHVANEVFIYHLLIVYQVHHQITDHHLV